MEGMTAGDPDRVGGFVLRGRHRGQQAWRSWHLLSLVGVAGAAAKKLVVGGGRGQQPGVGRQMIQPTRGQEGHRRLPPQWRLRFDRRRVGIVGFLRLAGRQSDGIRGQRNHPHAVIRGAAVGILDRHLAEHPDALTRPGTAPPFALVRLAHALIDHGIPGVTAPSCADCGKPSR